MLKKTDLRSQNDNSKMYREKRSKQTIALLKQALSHINSSDKNFSFKNVSHAMKVLATDEDVKLKAVITPSAISKNTHLKDLIAVYKTQNDIGKAGSYQSQLSAGDMAFELHKCKTLLAQRSNEVKLLKEIVKEENIEVKQNIATLKKPIGFDYKSLLKEAYIQMINDGTVFEYNGNLVLESKKSEIIASKTLLIDLGL